MTEDEFFNTLPAKWAAKQRARAEFEAQLRAEEEAYYLREEEAYYLREEANYFLSQDGEEIHPKIVEGR